MDIWTHNLETNERKPKNFSLEQLDLQINLPSKSQPDQSGFTMFKDVNRKMQNDFKAYTYKRLKQ